MRERDIFIEALQKENPADRAAYLQAACGPDTELRARVERLLLEHDRQESFILDSTAPGVETAPDLDPPLMFTAPGTVIGRYKILEPIGEGGYGTVFMAEQTSPVHRKVALKIIKAGMDTRQVIARFEAERQALALMDHPNIAKVFDAGTTETGRLYFVMELVKGIAITKYCDEHHLTPQQRLELFMQVCHAVQHAHQKGIIHRDLKPSNVLVAMYDGKPVPKVIDFGVAKATGQQLTERTMFTGLGDVIGTPEYMSPEQAELNQLDIDTRSDIYSLGVLLYELLTGTTPIEHKRMREAALLEVLRVIREEEPPKPSTRLSTTEQLPSIAANRGLEPKKLSGLVHGELDWIVMKALEKDRVRRYETANGFAMDVQRYLHDEAVHACPPSAAYRFRKFARRNKRTLVAAALLALVLVAGSVISTWQAMRARRAEALSQTRFEAEKRARDRAVTEALKANAVSDLMREMFESAAPNPKAGPNYTVRELLDDFSSRIGDQVKAQPEVELQVRTTIGNTYRRLALTKEAEPHLRKALELRRQVYGADHLSVGDALMAYALNLRQAKDAAGAERYAREALTIYQKQEASPKVIVGAYSSLSNFLFAQSKYTESEAICRESLALARQHGLEGDVAVILQSLSSIKRVKGSAVEAEKLSGEALAIQRRLHQSPPAYSILEHATNLSVQGKNAEAEPLLQEALASLRKSNFDEAHPSVIDVKLRIADLLRNKGDREGMRAVLEPLLPHLEAEIARAPDNLFGRMRKGNALRDLGKLDEAIKEYSEVISRKPDHDGAWRYRGDCYLQKGQFANAVADFSEVIKLKPADAGWHNSLAWLLVTHPELRDPKFAVELASKGVELAPDQAYIWNTLGVAQYRAGEFKAAMAALEKAMALGKGGYNVDWFFLAMSHWQLGNKEEARKWYGKAVERMEKTQPGNQELIRFRAEAEELLGGAKALASQLVIDLDRAIAQTPDAMELRFDRASALDRLGRLDEAINAYSEILSRTTNLNEKTRALKARGDCRRRMGDFAKMGEDFSALIELYQKLPSAALRSGELLALGNDCRTFATLLQGSDRSAQAAEPALKAVPLYQAATAEYEKLVSKPDRDHNPWEFAIAYEQVAVALAQTNQTREAENAWRDAQRIWLKLVAANNSADHRWHLAINCDGLAQVLKQSGRLDDCVQSYQQALAIWEKLAAETGAEDHRNHLTWSRQALLDVLRSQGKTAEAGAIFQKAEAQCREAIRQHPNDAELHRNLADVLRDQGKLDEAIAAYSEVIARKPGDQAAWKQRGGCYLRKGDLAKAIEYFTEAIKQKPDDPWYWHERAYCYMVLGQHDKAIPDHSKSIALGDTDADQRQRRGACYEALGDFAKAEQDYSRAIELNPRDWSPWSSRAQLYARRGESEKAQNDLANAARLASDPFAQNAMAWNFATDPHPSLRNPKLAVELAERAIAARPGDGNIWNTVGAARYRNGQWKDAILAFEKSMELRNGGDSNDWFFLAMCHWQLGDKEAARKWYDQAVVWMDKNQPKNEQLRRFRTEAEELLKIAGTQPTTKAGSK